MLKVKIKDNLRYFDQDDTDFQIDKGEVKELFDKDLKSYSIKYFLFTGRLQVVSGYIMFMYKNARIYIDKDGLVGREFGKYFTKDFELDTINFIDESEVSDRIKSILDGKKVEETEEIEKVEETKEEVDFDFMTLKELKEYAKENDIKLSGKRVAEIREELKN